MDGHRFDKWTRARANVTNRRSLVGWSLTVGLATVFTRPQLAAAQFSGGGSCTYSISLTSSLDTGTTVSGTLIIEISDGGAIDNGSLTLTSQTPASVVGQATGLAIDLLAALDDGAILSLIGVSHAAISDCSSLILGSLANADAGQIGNWTAQPAQNQTSSNNVQSAPPPTAPAPTPLPGTCEAPKMICGSACCPAGSFCLDTSTGACECPSGTEECGIACFPSCVDGTPLDPTTCLCPTA